MLMDSPEILTEKQNTVFNKLRQFITLTGTSPTIEELKLSLGFASATSVTQYLDSLEQHGLIRRVPHKKRNIELVEAKPQDEAGTLVLPVIASAGCDALDVFADETFDEYVTIDKRYLPKMQGPDNYAIIKAVGESMNAAGVENGDYVLVERTSDVASGDRVVAVVDDKSVLKRLRRTKEGGAVLEPESHDPRYRTIVLADTSRIFGKAHTVIPMGDDEDIVYEPV